MNYQSTQRICQIELDEKSIIKRNADIEHERRVAIFDLLETNHFAPKNGFAGGYPGPYNVTLRVEDNRLAIDLKTEEKQDLETLVLPLTPLRKVIKEYFLVCDNYFDAVKSSNPQKIEAIDVGRRPLCSDRRKTLPGGSVGCPVVRVGRRPLRSLPCVTPGRCYSRAAAPEMISVSSVVIWAWRARLN